MANSVNQFMIFFIILANSVKSSSNVLLETCNNVSCWSLGSESNQSNISCQVKTIVSDCGSVLYPKLDEQTAGHDFPNASNFTIVENYDRQHDNSGCETAVILKLHPPEDESVVWLQTYFIDIWSVAPVVGVQSCIRVDLNSTDFSTDDPLTITLPCLSLMAEKNIYTFELHWFPSHPENVGVFQEYTAPKAVSDPKIPSRCILDTQTEPPPPLQPTSPTSPTSPPLVSTTDSPEESTSNNSLHVAVYASIGAVVGVALLFFTIIQIIFRRCRPNEPIVKKPADNPGYSDDWCSIGPRTICNDCHKDSVSVICSVCAASDALRPANYAIEPELPDSGVSTGSGSFSDSTSEGGITC